MRKTGSFPKWFTPNVQSQRESCPQVFCGSSLLHAVGSCFGCSGQEPPLPMCFFYVHVHLCPCSSWIATLRWRRLERICSRWCMRIHGAKPLMNSGIDTTPALASLNKWHKWGCSTPHIPFPLYLSWSFQPCRSCSFRAFFFLFLMGCKQRGEVPPTVFNINFKAN